MRLTRVQPDCCWSLLEGVKVIINQSLAMHATNSMQTYFLQTFFLQNQLLSETFGVGFIILDLDIVDVNAVGQIICRTYYVCRLDLNLQNELCAPSKNLTCLSYLYFNILGMGTVRVRQSGIPPCLIWLKIAISQSFSQL